jgi:hypothetical protein
MNKKPKTFKPEYDPTAATPSVQEMANAVLTRYQAALVDVGVDADFLARCHKKELDFGGDEPDTTAMRIRQAARMDAVKAMDMYPAEKHEHESHLTVEVVNYGEIIRELKFDDEDPG